MRHLLASLGILLAAFAQGPARAGSTVVVELYTSQGCSSCPPADAFLAEIARRPDVIALSLHVDYWDYLGWRDDLARPEFAARQVRFNTAMKSRYRKVTPQLIFNGRDFVAGAHTEKALDYIEMLAREPEGAELELGREGDLLEAVIRPVPGRSVAADVFLVRCLPEVTREIARGENAGRRLTYANVVTEWISLGTWDGASTLRLTHPVDSEGLWAVLVQARDMGPMLVARPLQ